MFILALHPRAYGARSHLALIALDPLRLLAASSEFPDEAHAPTALDLLRLPTVNSEFPGARNSSAWARAAPANSHNNL